jgi:hypothetical protein
VALVSGGAALGVFGAVAVTSFKAIQDNLKLAGKGTQDLTSPVGRATTAYEGLTSRLGQVRRPTTSRLCSGVRRRVLHPDHSHPEAAAAVRRGLRSGAAVRRAAVAFRVRRRHGPPRPVPDRQRPPALEAFRQTFTNLGARHRCLAPQFARFSGSVETGMVGLSARFNAWAQNAGPGGGFQRFINYVVGTGPQIVSTLRELASAVVNIGKGMAPLGPVSLSFVGAMARLVSVLPPGVITGIAAGFLGLQGRSSLPRRLPVVQPSFGATPIGLAALALTGLIGVFVHHAQVVAESRARTEEFRTTLDKTTGAITLDTRAMAAHNLQTSGALDAAQKLGLGLATITDAAVGNQAAMGQVNSAVAAASGSVRRFRRHRPADGQGPRRPDRLAAGILTKALGGTSASQQRPGQAAAAGRRDPADDGRDRLAEGTRRNAKRALDQLSGALLKAAGVNLTAEQSEIQFRDSLASLTQSVKDNGRSLDINTARAGPTGPRSSTPSRPPCSTRMQSGSRPAADEGAAGVPELDPGDPGAGPPPRPEPQRGRQADPLHRWPEAEDRPRDGGDPRAGRHPDRRPRVGRRSRRHPGHPADRVRLPAAGSPASRPATGRTTSRCG